MEEYGSYNWNQQGNEPQNNTPIEPKKHPGKRNGNGAKWAKKIGAVALSAVLFGGVAGGVFTGVTYATGATAKAQSTQTDSNSKQETALLCFFISLLLMCGLKLKKYSRQDTDCHN